MMPVEQGEGGVRPDVLAYLDDMYPVASWGRARRAALCEKLAPPRGYLRPLMLSVLSKRFGVRELTLDAWLALRFDDKDGGVCK
jgi:hypothetical protein